MKHWEWKRFERNVSRVISSSQNAVKFARKLVSRQDKFVWSIRRSCVILLVLTEEVILFTMNVISNQWDFGFCCGRSRITVDSKVRRVRYYMIHNYWLESVHYVLRFCWEERLLDFNFKPGNIKWTWKRVWRTMNIYGCFYLNFNSSCKYERWISVNVFLSLSQIFCLAFSFSSDYLSSYM